MMHAKYIDDPLTLCGKDASTVSCIILNRGDTLRGAWHLAVNCHSCLNHSEVLTPMQHPSGRHTRAAPGKG